MDIKGAEDKLDDADSFLTKLEKLLKKHWLILLLILVGYFIYWSLTSDFEEEPIINPREEQYIVDEYYEYQENGDSILIEVWNDGIETIAK